MAVFVSVIYLLAVFYLDSTAEMDYKVWDIATVTASDFTVELTITPIMWDRLITHMQNQSIKDPQQPNSSPMLSKVDKRIIGL